MKQSQFVDALTNDIDGTAGAGSSAVLEALTAKKGATAEEGEDGEVATEEGSAADGEAAAAKSSAAKAATSAFEEMQEKLRGDLAALVEEKEVEIQ